MKHQAAPFTANSSTHPSNDIYLKLDVPSAMHFFFKKRQEFIYVAAASQRKSAPASNRQ